MPLLTSGRERRGFIFPIDFLFQNPGVVEGDHSSRRQSHRFTSLGIPSPPLAFLPDTEFSEAANHDVFTPFQGLLDQFEERLDDLERLTLGEQILGEEIFNDLRFGQSHQSFLENDRSFYDLDDSMKRKHTTSVGRMRQPVKRGISVVGCRKYESGMT